MGAGWEMGETLCPGFSLGIFVGFGFGWWFILIWVRERYSIIEPHPQPHTDALDCISAFPLPPTVTYTLTNSDLQSSRMDIVNCPQQVTQPVGTFLSSHLL